MNDSTSYLTSCLTRLVVDEELVWRPSHVISIALSSCASRAVSIHQLTYFRAEFQKNSRQVLPVMSYPDLNNDSTLPIQTTIVTVSLLLTYHSLLAHVGSATSDTLSTSAPMYLVQPTSPPVAARHLSATPLRMSQPE